MSPFRNLISLIVLISIFLTVKAQFIGLPYKELEVLIPDKLYQALKQLKPSQIDLFLDIDPDHTFGGYLIDAVSKLRERTKRLPANVGLDKIDLYYHLLSKIDKSEEGLNVLKKLITGFDKLNRQIQQHVAIEFPGVVKTLEDPHVREIAGL